MREYREGMREFARESFLDAWYERLDADELTARFGTKLDADGHELFIRTFEKGRRKTSARAVQQADRRGRREAALRERRRRS